MSSSSKLFQPLKVANMSLKQRIVLAPMTRLRTTSSPTNVPLVDMVKEYYKQRASAPGTLLITEATLVAPKAAGPRYGPGIWSQEQINAWKEITEAVHSQESYIFLQIGAYGRGAKKADLSLYDPSFDVVSASNIPLSGGEIPRPLTISEIHEFTEFFAQAARNAMEAGFDGVELHGANGYLIDQFHQDVTNTRTDEYGGSVENRARFILELLDATTKAIGQDRVAIRFSPWNIYQEMRMKDPKPQFAYTVSKIKELFPDLAYLHIIEPRIVFTPNGYVNHEGETEHSEESNQFIRDIWAPKTLVAAGGYNLETAQKTADEWGDLIAFGRPFTSNPDLTHRLEKNLPLTPYDRSTFYAVGQAKGYIDFPAVQA